MSFIHESDVCGKIKTAVSGVAVRRDLSGRLYAVLPVEGKRYFAIFNYSHNPSRNPEPRVRELDAIKPTDAIDRMLTLSSKRDSTVLVCDRLTAVEVERDANSLMWFSEDSYMLVGRKGSGLLSVFVYDR